MAPLQGVVIPAYSDEVPASHPQQDWTALVDVSEETITYQLLAGPPRVASHTHEGGDVTQTGCLNHQDKSVNGWVNNPNCVPSAEENGAPA
jgi:hypothetical protein